jgi:hypothetical protein
VRFTILAQGQPFTGLLSVSRVGTAANAELRRALLELGMAHSTDRRELPPAFPREFACCDQGMIEGVLVTGIASHKLRSGEDWHVSAEECREAVAAYDEAMAAGARHPDILGADFVAFLRIAALADGFHVTELAVGAPALEASANI